METADAFFEVFFPPSSLGVDVSHVLHMCAYDFAHVRKALREWYEPNLDPVSLRAGYFGALLSRDKRSSRDLYLSREVPRGTVQLLPIGLAPCARERDPSRVFHLGPWAYEVVGTPSTTAFDLLYDAPESFQISREGRTWFFLPGMYLATRLPKSTMSTVVVNMGSELAFLPEPELLAHGELLPV